MTRLDRRALFTSGAAAALLAATGVSAAPRRGGTLRVALAGAGRGEAWSHAPSGLFAQAAAHAVCEGLTEIAADGTLRGLLATNWQADGAAWMFEPRADAIWQDGAPCTPDHIAASLRLAGLDATVVQGQLRVVSRKADPNLPLKLAGSEYLIRRPDAPRLGTGLYRLGHFDPGRYAVLTRVETHRRDGQAGWLDRVEITQIPSPEIRAQALREQMVDLADIESGVDLPGFTRLPDAARPMQIIGPRVQTAAQVGQVWPLDNLRMAERWWIA